jgi:XTP/dITP diphosphohydrolase
MKPVITILLATRNEHKIVEIKSILGKSFECLSLKNLPGAPEVTEDAGTFAGNATKKAVLLANWVSGLSSLPQHITKPAFVLADDSGLEVDALKGAPGVHSARFAALDSGQSGNSSDIANTEKLLRLLQDIPRGQRTARFRCVLALTPVCERFHQGASPVCLADELELATELFEGCCEGWIEFRSRGKGGFGYDPVFLPAGYEQTFSELGEDIKNQMSHRAKALMKVMKCKQRLERSSPLPKNAC